MSREARSADAGSSEKPHGGGPRGWANGGTQNEEGRRPENKEKKTRSMTKSKYNGVERQGETKSVENRGNPN